MVGPRSPEEVEELLAHAKVYRVGSEYYAAHDQSEAEAAWRSQTGEPDAEEAEEQDIDLPEVWQGTSFTWRELLRSTLARGYSPPFWLGSTYD